MTSLASGDGATPTESYFHHRGELHLLVLRTTGRTPESTPPAITRRHGRGVKPEAACMSRGELRAAVQSSSFCQDPPGHRYPLLAKGPGRDRDTRPGPGSALEKEGAPSHGGPTARGAGGPPDLDSRETRMAKHRVKRFYTRTLLLAAMLSLACQTIARAQMCYSDVGPCTPPQTAEERDRENLILGGIAGVEGMLIVCLAVAVVKGVVDFIEHRSPSEAQPSTDQPTNLNKERVRRIE